jgi:hypothetical protein
MFSYVKMYSVVIDINFSEKSLILILTFLVKKYKIVNR